MAKTPNRPESTSPIGMQALIRFGDYAEAASKSTYPVSFRDFLGASRSHRTLVHTADAIEHRAKKLVMVREILDRQGKKTGDTAEHFQQIEGYKTRRMKGQLTRYGKVWGLLGRYVKDLIEYVLSEDADPEKLHSFLWEQNNRLMVQTGKRHQ